MFSRRLFCVSMSTAETRAGIQSGSLDDDDDLGRHAGLQNPEAPVANENPLKENDQPTLNASTEDGGTRYPSCALCLTSP